MQNNQDERAASQNDLTADGNQAFLIETRRNTYILKTKELLQQLGKTRDNPKRPLEKIQILIDYIADNLENNEEDEVRISEMNE